MNVSDIFNKKIVCIYPGAFQPFSLGHLATYEYLKDVFPSAKIFVASSNNTKERPLPFKYKKFLAVQDHIPPSHFIEVKSPYRCEEIVKNFDPSNTILIFTVGNKDKDRLGKPFKKDGSPSYFQPYPDTMASCATLDKNAYYIVAPPPNYSILGVPITSSTMIRNMYFNAHETKRKQIVRSLYPFAPIKNLPKIKQIFDKFFGEDNNIVKESPDFGYTKFIDKENKISNLEWDISIDRDNFIGKYQFTKIIIRAFNKEKIDDYDNGIFPPHEAIIVAKSDLSDDSILRVDFSSLNKKFEDWHNTGLGQLLYEKLIKVAKEEGFEYLASDWDENRNKFSDSAWKKLSSRHSVHHIFKVNGSGYYMLNLYDANT